MRRFHSAFFVAVVLLAPVSIATADDREVAAILSKAMKALGGEDKLSKIEAVTWKTTGWINMLYQGPEHFKLAGELTVAGLDRSRSEVSFDKESGLPLKAVGKALLFDDAAYNLDVTQEMIYSNYKDFGGIKTAAKIDVKNIDFKNVVFNRKLEVIGFKVLKPVDPSLFAPR